eukprot:GHVL01005658.1.p1 GENE.GHVL01005658.1~~GHVL01005658.1.p1  ORF type:complete len:975 (-),score=236.98 GHVL01005658.1:1958-4603(-)
MEEKKRLWAEEISNGFFDALKIESSMRNSLLKALYSVNNGIITDLSIEPFMKSIRSWTDEKDILDTVKTVNPCNQDTVNQETVNLVNRIQNDMIPAISILDDEIDDSSTSPTVPSSINTETSVDPLSSINPETSVDPLLSVNNQTSVNPLSSVNPETLVDSRSTVNPETSVNPLSSVNNQTSVDPLSSVNPETSVDSLSSDNSEPSTIIYLPKSSPQSNNSSPSPLQPPQSNNSSPLLLQPPPLHPQQTPSPTKEVTSSKNIISKVTAITKFSKNCQPTTQKIRDLMMNRFIRTGIIVSWRHIIIRDMLFHYISICKGIFTARAHQVVLRLAIYFNIHPLTIGMIYRDMGLQLSGYVANKKQKIKQRVGRGLMIAGAAVGGGALLAITGGLAAPAVAAGLGLVGVSGAAISLVTAPVVAALFGAGGAGLTGWKVSRRVGELQQFEFVKLNKNRTSLNVTIAVPGWLRNIQDVTEPWCLALEGNPDDCYTCKWETKHLIALGSTLRSMIAQEVATQAAQQWLKYTLYGTMASLAWPVGLISMANSLDNTWMLCRDRASQAGMILAKAVTDHRETGHRPVNLVGYSVGATAIFGCLQELHAMGRTDCINNVVLIGAPISGVNSKRWSRARQVVSGRLVNVYSRSDWLLGFLYRYCEWGLHVAGLQPVTCVAGPTVGPSREGQSVSTPSAISSDDSTTAKSVKSGGFNSTTANSVKSGGFMSKIKSPVTKLLRRKKEDEDGADDKNVTDDRIKEEEMEEEEEFDWFIDEGIYSKDSRTSSKCFCPSPDSDVFGYTRWLHGCKNKIRVTSLIYGRGGCGMGVETDVEEATDPVENYDVSFLVRSHAKYPQMLCEILHFIGFSSAEQPIIINTSPLTEDLVKTRTN